jgi:hypothetical protein
VTFNPPDWLDFHQDLFDVTSMARDCVGFVDMEWREIREKYMKACLLITMCTVA